MNKARWNIVTTVEAGNTNEGSTLNIQLFVRSDLDIVGDFWNDLIIPTVKLIYLPKNLSMSSYAYSYNDPHMKSFDGSNFEFHGRPGEYLMVENKGTLLRVHAAATHCNTLYHATGWNNLAYCNDRLYIQSIDDLITHDVSYPDFLYYKDLSAKSPVQIIVPFNKDGNAIIPKQNSVKIRKIQGRFKIITHFATIIMLSNANDGNFEVYPSKVDFESVWGLLGNYDKDPTNDLRVIEGGTVNSNESFFETYKIKKPRPFMSKGEYYGLGQANKITNLTQYCMCTNKTGEYEFKCPFGLTQTKVDKYLIKTKGMFSREQLSFETLESIKQKIDNFHSFKVFIKNENEKRFSRSKRDVADSCEQTLNIVAFQTCHQQGLINLNEIIGKCKLDFSLTGVDSWAKMYYESVISLCKMQLTLDKNTFINDTGVPQVQTELLSNLCINNCSYHGDCVLGVCNCTFPYTGDDCSMDRTIPANIYNSSMINNVCDIRYNGSCLNLILMLDKITPDMVVLNTQYHQTERNKFEQIDSQTESDAISLSRNLIYANLNLPRQKASGYISVTYYNVTVKDISTSSPVVYAIYDSKCQTCNSPSDCFVNAGTCNIDSDCYQNGDINPKNQNEICNHTNSKFKWSTKSQDLPNSSSISQLSVVLALAIIAKTVVSIALVIY